MFGECCCYVGEVKVHVVNEDHVILVSFKPEQLLDLHALKKNGAGGGIFELYELFEFQTEGKKLAAVYG